MKNFMMGLARFMALLGGFVLTLLIVLTCISILGRLLNGFFHGPLMETMAPGFARWMIDLGVGPVNGDFELVESGVAFAIFAFIPLCQITAGHASVDILTNRFSAAVNRFLRMITEIVFAAVLILIAWKLYDGMLSKMRYNETSFLLQFPIWWAYAASLFGAVVAAVVGTYVAAVRIYEFGTGRIVIWDGVETGS
ncbi:TRAP transporter small permease [Sedimentitalea nanhaiensis]|uniref:TRAP transporter small permease protein n=1 Tax=Sedimentitalea nanhaiensis TaxID=999627 RepID=A0A1I7BY69_9RHOB|nr:TRAP transporter small permease [Sedimentitalea nanhaiensis]SFT92111.1 Tripartite ATP-independent transporter, DctQ component [Sedimentitalea nanhaiensis]